MIEIIIRQILGLIKLLFQQLCNIFEPRASRCLELKLIGGDAARVGICLLRLDALQASTKPIFFGKLGP